MNGEPMRRRSFITLLGGAAAAWPLAARAQQRPAMPVVGWLSPRDLQREEQENLAFFRQGLGQQGFVEGRNFVFDFRFAQGHFDLIPAFAEELVRRHVDVIVAPSSTPAAVAAKAATSTIPIVFTGGTDPVQIGLVASLNRPGGNVTGISTMNTELTAKRLGLLHELLPGAARIAVLVNPTSPDAETLTREAQAALRTMGQQIELVTAATDPASLSRCRPSTTRTAGFGCAAPSPICGPASSAKSTTKSPLPPHPSRAGGSGGLSAPALECGRAHSTCRRAPGISGAANITILPTRPSIWTTASGLGGACANSAAGSAATPMISTPLTPRSRRGCCRPGTPCCWTGSLLPRMTWTCL
jgi:hypothetical protein